MAGKIINVVGVAGIAVGIFLMVFITGMVRDGTLLVAVALAFLIGSAGWRMAAEDAGPWKGKLGKPAAFLVGGLAVGIGFVGIVGLFAAHTDAYIWARGQQVQINVPTVEQGGGECRQVGSDVGGGTWDCDLGWTIAGGGEVDDGIADLSSAEMDGKADTLQGRALGGRAVSAGLGPTLANSQVVLGDLPWWVGPAGLAFALVLGFAGLVRSAKATLAEQKAKAAAFKEANAKTS